MSSKIKFDLISTNSNDPLIIKQTTEFNERFVKYMESKHYYSGYEFCNKIGLKLKQFQELNVNMLAKIMDAYPHLSIKWLLTGEGEMEDKEMVVKYAEMVSRLRTQGRAIDTVFDSYQKTTIEAGKLINHLEEQLKDKEEEIKLLLKREIRLPNKKSH